jgi:hypothetical protein
VVVVVSGYSGHVVLCFNSDVSSPGIKKGIPPSGILVCASEEVNLIEGEYFLNLYFHIDGTRVDSIEKACPFKVKTPLKKFNLQNLPDSTVCDYVVGYSFENH